MAMATLSNNAVKNARDDIRLKQKVEKVDGEKEHGDGAVLGFVRSLLVSYDRFVFS